MASTALGNCDMVLSVSENTINFQFKQLWLGGQILQTWKVLVRTTDGASVVKTQEDTDFDSVLQTWQTTQANIAALFSAGNYQAFGTALQAAEAAGQLWDYGWTGDVAAPVITILATDTQNLLFAVSFQSGTLLYCPDTTKNISTWDLAGTVYSFNVPIGQLQINSTQEILTPEGQNQANEVIRNSGLTESDFSIEALFLDFENADIANFDANTSHFPQDATTAIQNTVVDYFKLVVANGSNPFVLGYALNVNQITSQESLFQPTSARFSTSYSSQAGCSAVNFLMMSSGNDFPAGQNVGVLPQSLLEGAGLGTTGDGVFGIDWTVFNNLLIEPFVTAIAPAVSAGFPATQYSRAGQNWSLSATTSSTSTVDSPPSDLLKDTLLNSDRGLTSSLSLTNIQDGGLQLACTVEYTVSITVQPWEILHGGYHTEYSASLSTSGTYQAGPGGSAQVGSVTMKIVPGAQGGITFTVGNSTAPVLGYDSAPYTGSEINDGPWAIVEGFYNQEGSNDLSQEATTAASNLGGTMTGVVTSINSTMKSLSSGKVILPLGQLYTFNNIRLYNTTQQTDDNAVLMNVAYAPVSA